MVAFSLFFFFWGGGRGRGGSFQGRRRGSRVLEHEVGA